MTLPLYVINWARNNLTRRERVWIRERFTDEQIMWFVVRVRVYRKFAKFRGQKAIAFRGIHLLQFMLQTCTQCGRDNWRFRDQCIQCNSRSFLPIRQDIYDKYKTLLKSSGSIGNVKSFLKCYDWTSGSRTCIF